MVIDLALRQNIAATLKGIILILDMSNVKIQHATHLSPQMVKRLVNLWQACYPLRIKSIEFVNVPVYVEIGLNIFKQFMNQKLHQRTHIHCNSYTPIHEIVTKDVLPLELGGEEENYESLTSKFISPFS